MLSRSGASPPLSVAAVPQQRVVELVRCADTGTPAAKEGAAHPAALGVAECSLSDAPPQCDHRHVLDCQGLGRCKGGERLGKPEGGKGFILYGYCVPSSVILH